MSGHFSRLILSMLLPCALVASWAPRAEAQVDAGYLANWKDSEIRVAYDVAANRTSIFLALAPGDDGPARPPVLLVFEAQVPGREVLGAPATVVVSAYAGPLADPRVLRPLTMKLSLDEATADGITLPYFGTTWGIYGFIPAGDEIPVVRFSLTPSEIRALAVARTISGTALGYRFGLSQAELQAIQAFARTLRLN